MFRGKLRERFEVRLGVHSMAWFGVKVRLESEFFFRIERFSRVHVKVIEDFLIV